MSEVLIKPVNEQESQTIFERNYAEEIGRILTPGPELVAELRPLLWEAGEKVMSSLVDPGQRKAVEVYARGLDWKFFGRPGGSLPDGMVTWACEDDSDAAVLYDYRLPFVNASGDYVVTSMILEHFNGLQKYKDFIFSQSEQLGYVVLDYLLGSSSYQFLASFMEDPQKGGSKKPISAYWRQIKENQIEAGIRSRYALDDNYPLTSDSQALQEFKRGTILLDYDTDPKPKRNDSTPLDKAKRYFSTFEADTEIFNRNGETWARYRYGEKKTEMPLYLFADQTSHRLSQHMTFGSEDLDRFSGTLLRETIFAILTPGYVDSFEKALDHGLDRAKKIIVRRIQDEAYSVSIEDAFKKPGKSRRISVSPADFVRLLDGHFFEDWSSTDRQRRRLKSFVSEAKCQELENTKVGKILKMTIGDPYGVPRLITTARNNEDNYPNVDGSEDLILQLDSIFPFVPGLEVVSANKEGTYGFKRSNNGDPYARCDVLVDQDGRDRLVKAYSDLGLKDLAITIDSMPGLTVDNLVSAIKQNSVYSFRSPQERGIDICFMEDFEQLIKANKLHVQCTFSSLFLSESLKIAFGDGSVGFMNGFALSSQSSDITSLGHEQTVFGINGRQYILDATPGQSRGGFLRRRQKNKEEEPLIPVQLDKIDTEDIKDIVVEDDIQPVIPVETILSSLVSSLTQHCQVTFGLRSEEKLYEYLTELNKADPLRRTFEMVLQAKSKKIGIEEVQKGVRYLNTYQKADSRIKEKMGIANYSDNFIQYLAGVAFSLEEAVIRS